VRRSVGVGFAVVEGVASAEARMRKPVLGLAMVFAAATFFGLNGSVAKVALGSGLSSLRLTEARCAGPAIALMLFLLVRSPRALRVDRRDLLRLTVFGVHRPRDRVPRRDLADGVGVRLRNGLLVGRAALVELSRAPRRADRLAPGAARGLAPAGVGRRAPAQRSSSRRSSSPDGPVNVKDSALQTQRRTATNTCL
jgi:hypothetical protein